MPDLIPDTSRVRAFLRQRCPPALVDRLELTYVKVDRDGQRGRFLYEARDARGSDLRVSARQVGPESGRRVASSSLAGGAPTLYSPDLRMLFLVFPADRKLESLGTLTDAHDMARRLQSTLTDGDGRAALRGVTVHVVRYKPERKCVLRYELDWTTDASLPSVVYAKVLRPAQLGRGPRLLTWLRESAGPLVFDLPEPLGMLPRLGVELYSQVPGVPLSTLCHDEELPGMCRRVGKALRQLHGVTAPALPRRDAQALTAQLARAAAGLGLLLPTHRERIEGLRQQLARRLEEGRPARSCLIHGDFHGDNVLVNGGRVGLVDLDDCAQGDPAQDLGSMWAQLGWLSLKGARHPPLLQRAREAFLRGYHQGATEAAGEVSVQAALYCFLFAYQCLRHATATAQREQALALLTACDGVLERGLA